MCGFIANIDSDYKWDTLFTELVENTDGDYCASEVGIRNNGKLYILKGDGRRRWRFYTV